MRRRPLWPLLLISMLLLVTGLGSTSAWAAPDLHVDAVTAPAAQVIGQPVRIISPPP